MNVDPKDPKKADRDRFVLSKGHTAPGLYSALAQKGYFPVEDLETLTSSWILSAGTSGYETYPGCRYVQRFSGTGNLCSSGYGDRRQRWTMPIIVYTRCLGDGEIQEGQVWEASMLAGFTQTG